MLGDLIIEQWDSSSIVNTGNGNPTGTWSGQLRRFDLTSAGASRPTFQSGIGPNTLPGLLFPAGTFLQGNLPVLDPGPGATSLTNFFMAFVGAIAGGGDVYGAINDGVNVPRSAFVGIFGHYNAVRNGVSSFGAISSQVDDVAFHTVIATFCRGEGAIYVDGIEGTQEFLPWTPAANLNKFTLNGFTSGSLGNPGLQLQHVILGKQALPDPKVGVGNPVPPGSLVGRIQSYLKAKYGTP